MQTIKKATYHQTFSAGGLPRGWIQWAVDNKLPPMSSLADCKLLDLPKIGDARGNLTFIEGGKHLPFAVRRTYWIHNVPGGAVRGAHAFRRQQEFLVALSGAFDVVVDDGSSTQTFTLNRSYSGLLIPNMIWRNLQNFSTNSLCLVLASTPFEDDDYIRSYHDFRESRGIGT